MKYYRVVAKLLSPIRIRDGRHPDASVIPYLPGGSLRGALAEKYLRLGGYPSDSGFRALFVDDPTYFPNLFPTSDADVLPQILPITAATCKRLPGFVRQGGHGVTDLLSVLAAGRISGEPVDEIFLTCTYEPNKNNENSPCGCILEPFTGFFNPNADAPEKIEPVLIFQNHAGMDRATETANPNSLFTRQAMADFKIDPVSGKYLQQYLTGGMFIHDDQLFFLKKLIEDPVFAGSGKTTGMGEIELSIHEQRLTSFVFDLESWSDDFLDKLKRITGRKINQEHGIYFSIKLESDAILVDRFLRPTTEIVDLYISSVRPILKVARQKNIRSWQSNWNLAKPDDMAVAMGSVFLYYYSGEDVDSLISFLKLLEVTGIGLRREEGFGRISVCDPLHIKEDII